MPSTTVLNLVKTVLKALFTIAILCLALILFTFAAYLLTIVRDKEENHTKIQKPIALLKESKQRLHNQTKPIENSTLITPQPKLQLALPSSKQVTIKARKHNQTTWINHPILVTPAPLQTRKAKGKTPPKPPTKITETTEKLSHADLKKLTTILLKRECKYRNLKGYSKLTKPQLIELLTKNTQKNPRRC